MSQFDWGTLNPLTESGTQLMTDLNAFRSAVVSSHIGTTRPAYLSSGGMWINNATAPWVVYWCTTASVGGDVVMGYIDPTSLVFTGAPTEGLLVKSVAGASNVTLTSIESNNVLFEFTGVLTGNISVIVPNTTKRYQVENLTTGAFTLTVKTAAGTGIVIPQGTTLGLYCNGTNIEDANTAKLGPTSSTGSLKVPGGTTAQRDAIPMSGFFRYNTDTLGFEGYNGTTWDTIGGAPIVSPAFAGTPTAPTAPPATSNTQLATTAFVHSLTDASTQVISLTGGTLTLSATQALGSSFEFTGVLTSNAVVVAPNTWGLKAIENLTTGAFTLTVKTAAGLSVLISRNYKQLVYCNGTNCEAMIPSVVYTTLTTPLPGSGAIVSVAHGLGVVPTEATMEMVCTTAEFGYVVGDTLTISMLWNGSTSSAALPPVWRSNTNVGVAFFTGFFLYMTNKTTGANVTPTAANWSYRFVLRTS